MFLLLSIEVDCNLLRLLRPVHFQCNHLQTVHRRLRLLGDGTHHRLMRPGISPIGPGGIRLEPSITYRLQHQVEGCEGGCHGVPTASEN